jgi:hypothetical protein
VACSTTFYPGLINDTFPPDIVLLSSDYVFFYVHSHILHRASGNNFNALLEAPLTRRSNDLESMIAVPDESTILNIILHTIYGFSCAHFSPSFSSIVSTINALKSYGVQLTTYIGSSTPLYSLLLSHAKFYPLDVYALASQHKLDYLAVATSPNLLSLPLASITDEMAEQIGAVYLRRLFILHLGRIDTLRRLLLSPPNPHVLLPTCGQKERKVVTRAWALASAYLVWNARPGRCPMIQSCKPKAYQHISDLSTNTIESVLNPLADGLPCDLCKSTLKDAVQKLVARWSSVKVWVTFICGGRE